MTASFHIGQRLSYDGALCTVRYHGPLPGAKGDWLGVEWDRSERGKHNGSHQGQRLFHCISRSSTAASFLRPTRKPDATRTVLEALKFKYGSNPTTNGAIQPGIHTEADIVHISGKAVEEVGFEKIQKQIGQFNQLKVVLLDDLQVSGLTQENSGEARDAASKEFAETCRSLVELDLGWNLIEDWQEIADICKHLHSLRILKTSGLRLRSTTVLMPKGGSPFSNIEELHFSETLLIPDQILNILHGSGKASFSSLRTLSLSSNELSTFSTTQPQLTCPSITTLILENNTFTNLSPLTAIFTHFPSLSTLSLQSNSISSTSLPHTATFPTLTSLSLASNAIPNFTFISYLPHHFPSLASLRTTHNPFSTTDLKAPSDATYYLTLARISSLHTLNYTTITPRDREEGEIYYLSVAEKDIKSIVAAKGLEAAEEYVSKEYSRYAELCAKHERINILLAPPTDTTAQQTTYPPGSLASRIVNCTFYIPSTLYPPSTHPDTLEWTRPIPKTLNVYTLKSLVHKQFNLLPLQFKFIYESPELDPIPETSRKGWSTKEDWVRWGDFDVDVSPPGTSPAHKGETEVHEGKWIDGVLYRDGAKWKRRETEIIDGMRSWGDFLDGGEMEARIRVEPKMRKKPNG